VGGASPASGPAHPIRRQRRISLICATGLKLGIGQLIKSPIALGAALFYAMASLNTYGMLAWMPTIFQSGGMGQAAAAAAFSVFTFLTLPMALITPILATKLENVTPVAIALALVFPVGYIGIITAPDLALLWSFIMGIGGGAFPLAITMFNKRTRTAQGSVAIAGFAKGVGYLFGTLAPPAGRCALLGDRQLDRCSGCLRGHQRPGRCRRRADDPGRHVPGRQVHPY
jgi:cyanate permease